MFIFVKSEREYSYFHFDIFFEIVSFGGIDFERASIKVSFFFHFEYFFSLGLSVIFILSVLKGISLFQFEYIFTWVCW